MANGIGDFFSNRVHTETLCVGTNGDETCITKSELDTLLQNQNVYLGGGGNSDGGSIIGDDTGDNNEDQVLEVDNSETGENILPEEVLPPDGDVVIPPVNNGGETGDNSGDVVDDTPPTDNGSDTGNISQDTGGNTDPAPESSPEPVM